MSIDNPSDEIIAFMEKHTTLHKQVEVLYVVDGFIASINYDDTTVCCVHGETYKEALCNLIEKTKERKL